MLMRELKREKTVAKYRQRREELREKIRTAKEFEDLMACQVQLAKLPRNSSPVRHSTRCNCCGRPHAVYKKFNLCRICLRQQLMLGNVPGGRKSSW